MPFIAQVAVGKREFLNIFGDDYDTADGTCVRDYIHVVDLAKGHVKALDKLDEAAQVYTYNLGSGQGTSVLELVNTFVQVTGVEVPYQMAPRRAGDLASFYANADRALAELHWKTEKTIEDMCRDTWNWQSKNPNGFQE
jgi:UDP-glucose 4-epimerase